MAQYNTRKDNNKAETIARRAQRAARYANATMTNKSGRARKVAKAAF